MLVVLEGVVSVSVSILSCCVLRVKLLYYRYRGGGGGAVKRFAICEHQDPNRKYGRRGRILAVWDLTLI